VTVVHGDAAMHLEALELVERGSTAALASFHDDEGLGEAFFANDAANDLIRFAASEPARLGAMVWAFLDMLSASDAGMQAAAGVGRGLVIAAAAAEVREHYSDMREQGF
jgi:hypothetical protein